MSLSDVLRVKKLADNISFLRLFFLKTSHSKERAGLEVIDCILAIFLFELTRAFKASNDGYSAINSKDQFTFKILHFFSTLRLAKPCIAEKHQDNLFNGRKVIVEDSEEDVVTEDEDSGDPLTLLIQQLKQTSFKDPNSECANCLL